MFVADMWAGSLLENVVDSDMIENLVDSGGNWVDETEQDISVEMMILIAHDRLTTREIWMVPPSRVVCFGVWIVVRSGVCCIHILRDI